MGGEGGKKKKKKKKKVWTEEASKCEGMQEREHVTYKEFIIIQCDWNTAYLLESDKG